MISGGNGSTNGNIGFVKAGNGTLTLASPSSPIHAPKSGPANHTATAPTVPATALAATAVPPATRASTRSPEPMARAMIAWPPATSVTTPATVTD